MKYYQDYRYTKEISMEDYYAMYEKSMKIHGSCIQSTLHPSPELQLKAVQEDSNRLEHISEPTEEAQNLHSLLYDL